MSVVTDPRSEVAVTGFKEAARLLGVSEYRVRKLALIGKVRTVLRVGELPKLRLDDVQELAASGQK